jgi:hypothetical protein
MLSDREMNDAPAVVREEHQNEEHAASDGGNREEVDRDQGCCVIG